MTYTERNGSSLKACWLGGKRNHFDTGGLNIKTAGMVHMKCDMAGGAAVFGAMQLMLICNSVKVTIVPCAENAVTQNFFCHDIIHSYSGTSIEIIDTDAEGRLVLADGISYMIKKLQTRIYCRYRYTYR
jgi:leucyl aminopeptidase